MGLLYFDIGGLAGRGLDIARHNGDMPDGLEITRHNPWTMRVRSRGYPLHEALCDEHKRILDGSYAGVSVNSPRNPPGLERFLFLIFVIPQTKLAM